MLTGMHIEHEICQSSFQSSACVPINREPCAGEFGSAFEIEDPELLAKFPMRFRREIKDWRRPPTTNLHIFLGRLPDRHRGVRKIGNPYQHFAEPRVILFRGFLQSL